MVGNPNINNGLSNVSKNTSKTAPSRLYLRALKRLSNQAEVTPYIRAMICLQGWTSSFDYALPRHELYAALRRCNAFEVDLRNYRLIFPELNTEG